MTTPGGLVRIPVQAILAHESGFAWDEALMIAAPLVVIAALLVLARRRVRRQGPPPAA